MHCDTSRARDLKIKGLLAVCANDFDTAERCIESLKREFSPRYVAKAVKRIEDRIIMQKEKVVAPMKTASRRLENRMQDLRCSILHNWNMRRVNGPGVTPEDKSWFRCQAVKAVRELRTLQQSTKTYPMTLADGRRVRVTVPVD